MKTLEELEKDYLEKKEVYESAVVALAHSGSNKVEVKNARKLTQLGRRQRMPSALWFVGGVLVGTLASCMLFLIVMGSHEFDDYEGFDDTK